VLVISIALGACALALAAVEQLTLSASLARASAGFTDTPPLVRTAATAPWYGGVGFAASLVATLMTAGRSIRLVMPLGIALGIALVAFGTYGHQHEAAAREWDDVRRCAEEERGALCVQQAALKSPTYLARPDPLPLFAGLNVAGLVALEIYAGAGMLGYAIIARRLKVSVSPRRTARS
jgi:hypothetical protein